MEPEIICFYGTLRGADKGWRPGIVYLSTTTIHGILYNVGAFPALHRVAFDIEDADSCTVVCEVYEITDSGLLESFDRYEGYYPDDEEGSLYLRRKTKLLDGTDREAWVYVFNRSVSDYPIIESGDWFNR